MPDDEYIPKWVEIRKAQCCRVWPVALGVEIRKCGYCGDVPQVIGPRGDEE